MAEEGARQPQPPRHTNEDGFFSKKISSAFSSPAAYQRMDSEVEIDLAELESPGTLFSAAASNVHGSTAMDEADISLSRNPSYVTGNEGARTVSPLTVHESGQEQPSAPGLVISPTPEEHSEQAVPAIARKKSRQSRFTEMLRKSISSPWEKRMSLGDDGHDTDASRNLHDPNYLRPITEYDSRRNAECTADLSSKFTQAPLDCHSNRDVHIRRRSWLYITLVILSWYSTLLSGLWLVVSICQPRYGRGISSSNAPHVILPATASLLTTLFAKTTELSFVTVFVACLGQVLTRRSLIKNSAGMTIVEMTMRNWIIQPGSLFTQWEGLPYAAGTVLGALTLCATLSATFYTTASDAMVAPKLKFGVWTDHELQGLVRASYANPFFARDSCTTPLVALDTENAGPCLDVLYSGQSYRNLLAFMKVWNETEANLTSSMDVIDERPTGTAILYDNTTLVSSWIEAEFGDTAKNYEIYGRVVNNVTLAMPHPGVYAAATNSSNDILQPSDLSGVGEYQIRASVVSPAVNVMCVDMMQDELAPLVYTTWPNARNDDTGILGQKIGNAAWEGQVPAPVEDEWLNKTVVDGIFKWGKTNQRRPPVFQLFPNNFNIITNTTVFGSDSIYVLAKSNLTANYTLCQLRSWVTPKCSTQFNISGITGAQMRSHCEDPNDQNAYIHSVPHAVDIPSDDWKNLADQWRLSMDLNGGVQNSNASNARIMTDLILREPKLPQNLPTMAEALAVLASSTLVVGSLQSSFYHYWDAIYPGTRLDPGVSEKFNSSLKMQQYTSSHTADWQAIFYVVLGLVFFINVMCLLYLMFRGGMVTDFTEPQNLFALAMNSPPSQQLQGSCGGGPKSRQLVVPWNVGYSDSANHYFFEEAHDRPCRGKFKNQSAMASGAELLADGRLRNSYRRLS